MTETEDKEEKKEEALKTEQYKQLREMMIAQGAPRNFIETIPDEKLNDPEFLKRAVMKAQGLPIPTEGTYVAKEKKPEQEEGEASVAGMLAGMSITDIMELVKPMMEGMKTQFANIESSVKQQKTGSAQMYDLLVHIRRDIHLMSGGCLVEQEKTNPKFSEPGRRSE